MAQALVADKAGLEQDMPPRATPGRFDEAILVSDFLSPLEQLREAVGSLAGSGTRGHLVMVVDPVEETFPFAGQAVLHDPETKMSLDIGDAASWGRPIAPESPRIGTVSPRSPAPRAGP